MIDCPLPEVFFGGARYGGKTDGVLGKWGLKAQRYGKNFNAIMFRKTTTASEDAIDRAKEIYLPLGAEFVASPRPMFRMPHGGKVRFGYLDTVKDAEQFQGKNLTDGWTDEGGQYADSAPIDMLFGALRSPFGVPVQLIITANPGGPGQSWISKRYGLVPLPQRPKVVTRELPNGKIHKMAVIPSRITDNKIGVAGDPDYINRLYLVGSAGLVKAWLEGDWNAIEGAYFDCWDNNKHIIRPFQIPQHWTRFRSYDWGSASPGSVGWWAISDGKTEAERLDGTRFYIPAGAMVRYREWYVADPKRHNTGLKMTNVQQAKDLRAMEKEGERIDYSIADPSIFADKGGPTIAEDFGTEGVYFTPADNSRLSGWGQMRLRMIGSNGIPMIYSFSSCTESIRTIPIMPHSEREPEDLDTDAEDHIADEWRYACMSRPWVRNEVAAEIKPDRYERKSRGQKGSASWR